MKKASSLTAFSAIIFTMAMGNVLATDCSFINDGLVACYSFNGNADDESGNDHHGTIYGATTTNDRHGIANSAYHLDGVNDWVSLEGSTTPAFTLDSFTISIWFQTDADKLQGILQSTDGSVWGLTGYGITILNLQDIEGGYRAVYPNKNEMHIKSTIDSSWHNVTLVRDVSNTIGHMYFDGILAVSGVDPDPLISVAPQSYIRFGQYIYKSTEAYLDGNIDDIRFYNRALSASEFPPSTELVTTSGFDLTLILKSPDLHTINMAAILDGNDITVPLSSCVRQGTLLAGGETFRCPSLKAGTHLGAGSHTLSVTLNLNDGSSISDEVVWEVLENTE